jgi:hypothetical protein
MIGNGFISVSGAVIGFSPLQIPDLKIALIGNLGLIASDGTITGDLLTWSVTACTVVLTGSGYEIRAVSTGYVSRHTVGPWVNVATAVATVSAHVVAGTKDWVEFSSAASGLSCVVNASTGAVGSATGVIGGVGGVTMTARDGGYQVDFKYSYTGGTGVAVRPADSSSDTNTTATAGDVLLIVTEFSAIQHRCALCTDQSGNGASPSQGTLGYQPLIQDSGILFDGFNDYLSYSVDASKYQCLHSDGTLIGRIRSLVPSTQQFVISTYQTSSALKVGIAFLVNSSNELVLEVRNGTASLPSASLSNIGGFTSGVSHTVYAIVNAAKLEIGLDGTTSSAAPAAAPSGADPTGALQVSSFTLPTTGPFNGYEYAWLAYSRELTSIELARISAWLEALWP